MSNAPLTSGDQFGVSVDVEHHGAATVLRVAGELDLLTTPTFTQACEQELGKRPPVLVIDLTGVTFLASVGMSAIVSAHEAAGERTKVRVVAGTRDTLRPIRVTGLDKLLSVYSSLPEALEALADPES
ncbi:STAS domain-containing protein [Actinophytocola sp.]|uniref:STAS domain-containing protein n=1 Tax=Actinophytocola sp. TaxID=1872138 RepID=UPI00389A1DBD